MKTDQAISGTSAATYKVMEPRCFATLAHCFFSLPCLHFESLKRALIVQVILLNFDLILQRSPHRLLLVVFFCCILRYFFLSFSASFYAKLMHTHTHTHAPTLTHTLIHIHIHTHISLTRYLSTDQLIVVQLLPSNLKLFFCFRAISRSSSPTLIGLSLSNFLFFNNFLSFCMTTFNY